MTCNMASWDRALRIIVGVTLLALGWTGIVTGTPGLVCKVVGFVPLATGIAGICPAYLPFGFSTRRP